MPPPPCPPESSATASARAPHRFMLGVSHAGFAAVYTRARVRHSVALSPWLLCICRWKSCSGVDRGPVRTVPQAARPMEWGTVSLGDCQRRRLLMTLGRSIPPPYLLAAAMMRWELCFTRGCSECLLSSLFPTQDVPTTTLPPQPKPLQMAGIIVPFWNDRSARREIPNQTCRESYLRVLEGRQRDSRY